MRDLKTLFSVTGGLRRFIILLILRCPFDALQTVIQALFLQFGFNAIDGDDLSELYLTCAVSVVGFGLLFLYNGTMWTIFAINYTKWIATIRRKLFWHVSALSLQKIDTKPTAEWITRFNSDVQVSTAIFGHPVQLPHAAYSIVNIIVSSIFLINLNPAIYGLIVLFVIPHLLISQFIISKPMTSLATKVQEVTSINTTDMNVLVTCANTAILYDAGTFLISRFRNSSLELRKANMKICHRNALSAGLLPLLGMSGYLIIILIAGVWIADGKMTFGDLTAAFQYRGGVIIGAMILSRSLLNIKTSLSGIKRINETMQISMEE